MCFEVGTGRPVKFNIRLMLHSELLTVLLGLVLLKEQAGSWHAAPLPPSILHVGGDEDSFFGAFDLVRRLVKTLRGRCGLLLQLLMIRQAVVLQISKGGGHLFQD